MPMWFSRGWLRSVSLSSSRPVSLIFVFFVFLLEVWGLCLMLEIWGRAPMRGEESLEAVGENASEVGILCLESPMSYLSWLSPAQLSSNDVYGFGVMFDQSLIQLLFFVLELRRLIRSHSSSDILQTVSQEMSLISSHNRTYSPIPPYRTSPNKLCAPPPPPNLPNSTSAHLLVRNPTSTPQTPPNLTTARPPYPQQPPTKHPSATYTHPPSSPHPRPLNTTRHHSSDLSPGSQIPSPRPLISSLFPLDCCVR